MLVQVVGSNIRFKFKILIILVVGFILGVVVMVMDGSTDQAFLDANTIRVQAGLPELSYEEYLGTLSGGGIATGTATGTAEEDVFQPNITPSSPSPFNFQADTGATEPVAPVVSEPTQPAPLPAPTPAPTPLPSVDATNAQSIIGGQGVLTPDAANTIAAQNPAGLTGANEQAMATYAATMAAIQNAQIAHIQGQVAAGTIESLASSSDTMVQNLTAQGVLTPIAPEAITPQIANQLQTDSGAAFDRALQMAVSQFEGMGRHDAVVLAISQSEQLRQQYISSVAPLQLANGSILPSISPFSFLRNELGPLFALDPIARRGGSPGRGIIQGSSGSGVGFGNSEEEEDFLGAGRLIG